MTDSLLKQRRFVPYFLTQFLGAFNDNVFKNALIILIAFRIIDQNVNFLTNLGAALFILPFFLFSASAGQLADKYEKSGFIRYIKLAEVIIMLLGAVGFYLNSLPVLMAVLFLMGTQSAVFGPIKYGILPQHLKTEELVAGNGLVQMGTFLAILIGTITGGVLIGLENIWIISSVIVAIAILGLVCSWFIPYTPAVAPDLSINFNPFSETVKNLKFAFRNRTLFLSMLGISWFWFLGATYLTQLPNFTRLSLGGNEQVVTLLLAVFSIGVGAGSLLCNNLSGERVEIGLVPLGSIGLTLFGLDLFLAHRNIVPSLDFASFLSQWGSWRLLMDMLMIGVFGGFYIVPLYAQIQQLSQRSHLSRMIAANNVLNALLMVISAVVSMLLLEVARLSIPQLFLVVALLNAAVALYIYSLVPEFLMRFIVWMIVHAFYRVKKDVSHIPVDGAALLVCNHVSYVDVLILTACCPRPIRFVMDDHIFRTPLLNFVFRTAKVIPIAGGRGNIALLRKAYDQISGALSDGELVCIFPEGRLSRDGEIHRFLPGLERIVARNSVPVIPLALRGLWGSIFSRNPDVNWTHILRRLFAEVELVCAPAIPSEQASASLLEQKIRQLRGILR